MEKASKNFISNLKKQKREGSLLFLDNVKIIKDAISKSSIKPQFILTSLNEEEFLKLGIVSSWEIGCNLCPIYQVEDFVIEQLADTKTPQKVLCIAYLTQNIVEIPKSNFLVLDGLQDPGNVGTLIRCAFASEFEYIFLVDSVRKTNSKLIRSSVGAVFDSKVFEMSHDDFVNFVKENNLYLICCDMNGENIFDFADKLEKEQSKKEATKPQCIGVVVGNEGQGVSEQIANLCQKTVKIPMKEGIESLNAGVSGSIIMYEINKRRF